MRWSTPTRVADAAGIARARPLLGTIVSIRVSDQGGADALATIGAAFAGIALVHRLMSYQEAGSELNLVNRVAALRPVPLHPLTRACLAAALDHARASGGAFDPVVTGGTWRDIALEDGGVRHARPLAIDLSGIAKGFAVDHASEILIEHGVTAGVVNAGGDLRAFGPIVEDIALRPSWAIAPAVVTLRDGAIASSDTAFSRARHGRGQHRDGRDGAAVAERFASVAAARCVDADALTKVVLALGDGAAPALARWGASGWRADAAGWRAVGLAAAA